MIIKTINSYFITHILGGMSIVVGGPPISLNLVDSYCRNSTKGNISIFPLVQTFHPSPVVSSRSFYLTSSRFHISDQLVIKLYRRNAAQNNEGDVITSDQICAKSGSVIQS